MTTELTRFTHWAKTQPQKRYTALMGMLADEHGLAESYYRQDARKAVGVDGVRKEAYGENLQGHIADLKSRLRRMGYRPKPARRVYIPKSNGGQRPLGIPSFEDRLVQDRLSQILGAIWEPEFRDCSFGFRPGRSAHHALARLDHIIIGKGTQWLVEADIKGFFDNVNHEHLMRFVAHRIGDKNLLRLIQRLLKAGVIDAGTFSASDSGTPQGGLVSPILANIYLHYVPDLWFEKRVVRKCQDEAYLVRYADDFVACFRREADARDFEQLLKERLEAFGLEVEPTKTALLRFGTLAPALCKRDGRRKPGTFNFLGFTHYLKIGGRSGRVTLGRKTQRDRFSKKLKMVGEQLVRLRTQGTSVIQAYVRRHLLGHIQYYGVRGNYRSLHLYQFRLSRLLYKWLNRRSQSRSFNWEKYNAWLKLWYPRPRIVHQW